MGGQSSLSALGDNTVRKLSLSVFSHLLPVSWDMVVMRKVLGVEIWGTLPAWPEVWVTVLILGAGIITQYFPFSQLFPLFAPGGCCGLEDQTKLLGLQA